MIHQPDIQTMSSGLPLFAGTVKEERLLSVVYMLLLAAPTSACDLSKIYKKVEAGGDKDEGQHHATMEASKRKRPLA
jgi:hypothetical protein